MAFKHMANFLVHKWQDLPKVLENAYYENIMHEFDVGVFFGTKINLSLNSISHQYSEVT